MDILGFVFVPNWLLILLFVLVTYYMRMTMFKNTFKKTGIPVPGGAPVPIIGHYLEYYRKGTHICDKEWTEKYGKVFGVFMGPYPQLVISDTEMMKQILVKEFSSFTDRPSLPGANGELEKGINILKGEHWKHVRNILTPTFSSGKLKHMMPLILRASECLVQNLRMKLKESNNQDIKRVFGGYTLDVIASTAFGVEVDSQSDPDDPLVKHASKMFTIKLFNITMMVLLFVPLPLNFILIRLFGMSYFRRSSGKFFRQLIIKIIRERKLDKKKYKDFLQLMLEVKRLDENEKWDPTMKGLSTEEIISQSILFFAAGYETTGTTLSLLAYNLALNQDKQQKLYEEVMEKLGSEIPSYENLQQLTYMEMCINETLRLFPPATRVDRSCVKDTELKGIKIAKYTTVSIPVYAIHHSPEIWEDPEEFKPERFSPEERAKIDPLHFLPFGYGPRICIGMRLAYLEAKVALVDFVRNFHVSVCEKTKIPPKFEKMGLITPADVWLKIEERR